MSFLNIFGMAVDMLTSSTSSSKSGGSFLDVASKAIDYGGTTAAGGHDHRDNKGDDRTPAQKKADEAKRKK
jgi:hypothetical protein